MKEGYDPADFDLLKLKILEFTNLVDNTHTEYLKKINDPEEPDEGEGGESATASL